MKHTSNGAVNVPDSLSTWITQLQINLDDILRTDWKEMLVICSLGHTETIYSVSQKVMNVL